MTRTGYSKNESQQNAAKDTLQRLRREPQFIDAVFAAKGDRTKMEEEPVMVVPDPEKLEHDQQNFIIEHEEDERAAISSQQEPAAKAERTAKSSQPSKPQQASLFDDEELTLDDIQVTPQEKSREEIIAEAEAAAFAEMEKEN